MISMARANPYVNNNYEATNLPFGFSSVITVSTSVCFLVIVRFQMITQMHSGPCHKFTGITHVTWSTGHCVLFT